MSTTSPVPGELVQAVHSYVYSERSDAEKYENREPLDDSGVWSLHRLVERAYALGYSDGHRNGQAELRDP